MKTRADIERQIKTWEAIARERAHALDNIRPVYRNAKRLNRDATRQLRLLQAELDVWAKQEDEELTEKINSNGVVVAREPRPFLDTTRTNATCRVCGKALDSGRPYWVPSLIHGDCMKTT